MNHSNDIAFKHKAKSGLISVIIPVKGDLEGLSITLRSLINTVGDDTNYEIIVANDGADPALSLLIQQYETVRELPLNPNRGPAGARNEALSQSKGEYIAFLDADVEVADGWWSALRHGLEDYDYVAGRVDINPHLIHSLFHAYDEVTAFDVKGYMARHHGATANLAVRRELLEKIGGFDARFRSGEDTEFGIRAHEESATMLYQDNMIVLHPPRTFAEQRKKIYRVVLGHLQLAETFPERFGKYKLSKHLVLSLLFPPRKVAKDPALMQGKSLMEKLFLYVLRYVSRVYILFCYLWLMAFGTKGKKHDLS